MSIYQSDFGFSEEDLVAQHLSDFARIGAQEHGDAAAFSCVLPTGHSASISYAQLDRVSDDIAVYLREVLGLRRGDVVAIQSPNALGYMAVAFGVLKAGVIFTNVNPLYTVDETNHQLKDSGAKALFVIDVFGDKVAEAIESTDVEHVFKLSLLDFFPSVTAGILGLLMKHVKKVVPPFSAKATGDLKHVIKEGRKRLNAGIDVSAYLKNATPDDIAFYQYTGGTTGRSKGAALNHRNIVANVSQGHKLNDSILGKEQETLLLILPLYHVYALAVGAMSSMINGTHVVLVPSPRPLSNLRHAFENYPISVLPGINTLFVGLMQEDWFVKNPPQNLKYCFSGAAPLHDATAKEWTDLTGCDIHEGYGLTECTCAVSTTPLSEKPIRGTCGKALPGTMLRIVGENGEDQAAGDPGELWVKGPQVMQGYLNRPEASAESMTEDGWLKTGDVATIDADGWLRIVDRMKDMIIVSGFNVYPTDIEDVLTKHAGVADAAVVGVPNTETGERVIAYVVASDAALTSEALTAYCREHLTGYKMPRVIEIIDELPKSPVGKVLRRELRDIATKQYGR